MTCIRSWIGCLLFLIVGNVSMSQNIQVIKYPDLENMLKSQNDTVLIVNFWATWCAPCVKELPYFEKLQIKYANEKVKVILVSLDYSSVLEKKVKPFIAKTGIKSASVFLLNETDPNAWMGKVDTDWSGALPFTLIIKGEKQRKSYERAFTLPEMEAELKLFIQ
tara:strand:+ start:536 stop:1027 length:492 start_codon:yes stop_codon:yes gene_type:complete